MGQPKLVLELEGETLLARAVRKAQEVHGRYRRGGRVPTRRSTETKRKRAVRTWLKIQTGPKDSAAPCAPERRALPPDTEAALPRPPRPAFCAGRALEGAY